jgi:hypothetical protein
MNAPSEKLHPISDQYLQQLKHDFFHKKQKIVDEKYFLSQAEDWFRGSKLNDITGWGEFSTKNIMLGCTHFIESTCLRYGWNIQHLPNEYSYYSINGKAPTQVDDLKENMPLIISLPTWQRTTIHEQWEKILKICEQRNIDIHIDGAWFQSARNIQFDFDHPNIQSFGMSIGKGLDLTWNRIGVRWSKKVLPDSITIMNKFGQIHQTAISCGSFLMENIEKDYAWNKYSVDNLEIANKFNLSQTNSIHTLVDSNNKLWGIGKMLGIIK